MFWVVFPSLRPRLLAVVVGNKFSVVLKEIVAAVVLLISLEVTFWNANNNIVLLYKK